MKSRTWIALGAPVLLAGSLALAMPLGAQQTAAAASKVAVIDGEQVLAESNIGRNAMNRARQRQNELNAALESKQQEINNMIRQAQEQALTLNEEALARLQTDIERAQIELQRMSEDRDRELARLQAQLQNEINAQLIPAVERLAAQYGYDLILDNRIVGILYYSDAVDATDEFLSLVNADTSGTTGQQ